MKQLTWSDEQKAIFAFYESGTGHAIVKAYAGTGKTTTIKEAFSHAPEGRMLYAVFNKRNQKEAEEKITDQRVDVRTLHSLGFMFIKRNWSNAKPDDDIELERAESVCGVGDKEYLGIVCKLVGLVKNMCVNPTEGDIVAIIEDRLQWDTNAQSTRELCGATLKILALSKVRNSQGRISFNDMVWLPCAMNWVRPVYDMVTIDEAQDMNTPQLLMARQASKGRVIVVGDDRQAIYGFRGAASGGMAMMKITLRAIELKLTTTYRCPKAVVKEANSVVPEYQAADTAPDGLVGPGDVSNSIPGDSILSRLNAPLMPIALQLIRAGKPARIEGRDIGKQLLSMVRSLKAKSVPDFIGRVESWLAKQIERLEKQKKAEKRIEQAEDIAATLKAVAEGCKGVSEVEQRIQNLFEDTTAQSRPAIVLSSVHKAKGLEWPRVFLLAETFRRGKGTEEDNIYYVAVTRAMKELYLVGAKQISPAVEPSHLDVPRPVPAALLIAQPAAAGVLSNYDLPTNTVYHQLGNVIKLGGTEHVCIGVNDCTAKFVPCRKVIREIVDRFDDSKNRTVEFTSSKQQNICSTCEPDFILRVMPKAELQIFLDRAAGKSKEKTETGTKQTTEENSMSKKIKAVKSTTNKPEGKMALCRRMLSAGEDREKILKEFLKKFPGTKEKTARNSIAWVATGLGCAKPAAKTPSKPAKASKVPAKPSKPAGKKAPQKPASKLPQAPSKMPPPMPSAPAAE